MINFSFFVYRKAEVMMVTKTIMRTRRGKLKLVKVIDFSAKTAITLFMKSQLAQSQDFMVNAA